MQRDEVQQKTDEQELDLVKVIQNIVQIVKRLWLPMLLVIALLATVVVFVQQKNYTPSYKAYCTFSVHVINKATLSDTNSMYAVYYDQDLAEQLDATFTYLISSDLLTDDIKEYLGTDTIDGSMQANSIKGSNIFVISTYADSPEKAGALLEALMAVYYDAARYVVGDMKTEIIEGPVVSQTPDNVPNRVSGIVFGAAIGLVINIAAMVLYVIFKRTVLEPSDLEQYLNIQCLGVIPLLQAKRNLADDPAEVSTTHERGLFRESIRGIARKLENAMENGTKKVILVTSTAPGEGKSTLCQNLADTFAHWGKKVVLVDGDLRRPALHHRYGFKQDTFSLEKVLEGQAPVDTVLRRRHNGNLTLVLNSVPMDDPTVGIDSSVMKQMIASFASQADVVIIDAPPCNQLSDASLYQQYADGILYVVQQERIPIRRIVDAAENLCSTENKLLGYVLNGAEQIVQGYGRYGYGKYSYGKYGNYGKYGYGKYGSDGESDRHSKISER
ncbi:MAG: polysaccharide biosynthesis tyrosine autokinase [Oscillospiraceae bacterium]|nr:polysaccharide biosynthesis tyrosine autokinase [Oscillospiraceae bacterium]